jgi:outer membrane lipoprotein carrier protein
MAVNTQRAYADDGLLEKLKNDYSTIKTLRGEFVQRTYIRDLEREDTFKGVFFLSKPDRMKWEYTTGSSDEVYLKGKEIVLYQPSESQAFTSSTDRFGLSNSPLRILMSLSDIERDFVMKEEGGKLRLIPKKIGTMIESIELQFSDSGFFLGNMIFTDSHGNRTEVDLNTVEINKELAPSLFEFRAGEGTVMIRQ